MMIHRLSKFLMFLLCVSQLSCSRPVEEISLTKNVERLKLENGMTFLFLKRGEAPVFSARAMFRVGSIEEGPQESGLAHFFEHMAFKGTDKIGTTDYAKEKLVLEDYLRVGEELTLLKKNPESDKKLIDAKSKEFDSLLTQAKSFVVPNEFVTLYQKNGAVDLNASTSSDFTTYQVDLPTSKLELWAYVESERLKKRVFREFFSERNVVIEERRMRLENSPEAQLYEKLLQTAFKKSPYRIMPIGLKEDIFYYTPSQAQKFYEKFYRPSRLVVALVGQFDVEEAKRIVKTYFSGIPEKGKDPIGEFAHEDLDPSEYPKTVTLTANVAQPRLYLGYHRPAYPHPDDIVLDVISELLCDGKKSRVYGKLVWELKLASSVGCSSSTPGARLPALFAFFITPAPGVSLDKIKEQLLLAINEMIKNGVKEEEFQLIRNRLRARAIYRMDSNQSLSESLAYFEILTGDFNYIVDRDKLINAVTIEDIKRVLSTYFVSDREVDARLLPQGAQS